MKKHLGLLWRLAFLALVVIALALFARTINWPETWRAVRATSLGLLVVAAAVNMLSLVVKGARWWIFLRPIGVHSLGLAIRGTFVGAGLNNVLVANGGEAARVVFVSRAAHVSSANVLASLALERLFEVAGYVVLLALAVSFLHLPPSLDQTRPLAIISLILMVAFLVYLVRHPAEGGMAVLEGEGLLTRARNYGRVFMRTMTTISTGPRFAAAMATSVMTWALQVTTYQLTAKAAHFDISVVGTVGALLACNLGFVVRATPGGVGVFQVIYAVTAAAFGFNRDQATGVAFLIQIQQILPVTILGLLLAPRLLFSRRHSRRADNILPGEPTSDDGQAP